MILDPAATTERCALDRSTWRGVTQEDSEGSDWSMRLSNVKYTKWGRGDINSRNSVRVSVYVCVCARTRVRPCKLTYMRKVTIKEFSFLYIDSNLYAITND